MLRSEISLISFLEKNCLDKIALVLNKLLQLASKIKNFYMHQYHDIALLDS